jgi:hypothetical protein
VKGHRFHVVGVRQAFFFSGQPAPGLKAPQLSLTEQCRVRDRCAIVARHLFSSDRGDVFADQQALALTLDECIKP